MSGRGPRPALAWTRWCERCSSRSGWLGRGRLLLPTWVADAEPVRRPGRDVRACGASGAPDARTSQPDGRRSESCEVFVTGLTTLLNQRSVTNDERALNRA